MRFRPPDCPFCAGSGYHSHLEHGCSGDVNYCDLYCPVEVPYACDACRGTGEQQYVEPDLPSFTIF